jgi:hypothetical protein
MRTRLAAGWSERGWEYDSPSIRALLDAAESRGAVDPAALAATLPGSYLTKIGADREGAAEAIADALGPGMLVESEPASLPASINAGGDVITFNLADGAQIIGSNFNFSSNQVNLDAAEKPELLASLQAALLSGLSGSWDPAALAAIGSAIETRGDFELEEVRDSVAELGREADFERSRVSELIEKVAVSGFGSFFSVALSSGLTELLELLG